MRRLKSSGYVVTTFTATKVIFIFYAMILISKFNISYLGIKTIELLVSIVFLIYFSKNHSFKEQIKFELLGKRTEENFNRLSFIFLISVIILSKPLQNSFEYTTYSFSIEDYNPYDFAYNYLTDFSWDEISTLLLISPVAVEIQYRLILICILARSVGYFKAAIISSFLFCIISVDLSDLSLNLTLSFIFLRWGIYASISALALNNLSFLVFHDREYFSLFQSYPYLTYLGACLYVALLYYCIRYCYLYRTDQYKPLTFLRAGY